AWDWHGNSHESFVDVLVGYQRWKEQYVATDTQDLDPLGLGAQTIDQGKALSEEFTWNNARLGVRTAIRLLSNLSFRGSAYYLPYVTFYLKDIHHFRSDLRQDPSFHGVADQGLKGSGAQVEAGFSYRVWQSLTLDLGYRFWTVRSPTGTITARETTGDTEQVLNRVTSTRHGVLLGIGYTF